MPVFSALPRRARVRALTTALAASLALAGCSSAAPSAPTPSPTSATAMSVSSSAGVTAPASTDAAGWAQPAQVAADGISGLDLRTVSDNKRGTHLTYPQVPGAEPLNTHLADEAKARAEQFWKDTKAVRSSGATPTLNGVWGVVGASAQMLGIMTTVTEEGSAAAGVSAHTHWYDAGTDAVLAPTDLVTPAHTADLERTVRDLADRLPGAAQGSAQNAWSAVQEGRVRLWFAANGDLMLGFDSGAVLAADAGTPAVAVPAATVEPWLSPAGKAVRQAAQHPDVDAWSAAHRPQADASAAAASSSAAALLDQAGVSAAPSTSAPASAAPSSSATASPGAPSTRADAHGATDCSVAKCVALTFDDGPKPSTDGPLLKILAAHNVKATFFMIGTSVGAFPETARQIAAAGHELGNHSTTHVQLTQVSAKGAAAELSQASAAIASATGVEPKVMRPPYGATNASVKQAIADAGMRQVLWDVDTLDWKTRDPASTLAAVKSLTHRDSIILMHDIHPTSVEAVDSVVTWLQDSGYTLVTVSDLLDG